MIRLDVGFILCFVLLTFVPLYTIYICCLHIGHGLIVRILRSRDLNYTSDRLSGSSRNEVRMFWADPVDTISI